MRKKRGKMRQNRAGTVACQSNDDETNDDDDDDLNDQRIKTGHGRVKSTQGQRGSDTAKGGHGASLECKTKKKKKSNAKHTLERQLQALTPRSSPRATRAKRKPQQAKGHSHSISSNPQPHQSASNPKHTLRAPLAISPDAALITQERPRATRAKRNKPAATSHSINNNKPQATATAASTASHSHINQQAPQSTR
jgi:hypothetical protein